jgi:uncharacterized protein
MIIRTLSAIVQKNASSYPVVAVTGPRQSGKTVLVKSCFPDRRYASLEDPDIRDFALSDPRGFLATFPDGGILDEIQRAPELLSYIQGIVDDKKRPGMFILTGSNQFLLMKHVSQSLSGRISILKLLPFTISEFAGMEHGDKSVYDFMVSGGYPSVVAEGFAPTEWYKNYIETYLEKDLKDILHVSDVDSFRKLLVILASACGQLLNLSQIGTMLGINHNTVKSWIAALEQSYLVFLLQPYFKNYSKRIVKMPKLYFYDTGLACALLQMRSAGSLSGHVMRGQLFENLIVSEIKKENFHENRLLDFYFWRDHTGHEIDVLFEKEAKAITLEIKSGQTINDDYFDGIRYFNKLSGGDAADSLLVYGGNEGYLRNGVRVLGWRNVKQCLT